MQAAAILYYVLVAPACWLVSSIVSYTLLILTVTVAWRAYKTVLVRELAFLRRRHLKPVEARQAVLITGASSGIGLAVAKHLHKVGFSVVATYLDQNDPGYEELRELQRRQLPAASKPGRPNKLLLHQLDVTVQEQVRQLFETVASELDEHQLDLYALINNAGLGSLQPFAWLQRRTMLKLLETNISGALLMTREFLPLLARPRRHTRAGFGASQARLLFVSSGLGFVPGATYATYGLTKSAHLYFSRCLNIELKERYGVQSVAVVPHNFIKNTNICAQNVLNNQAAWDELRPLEREIYAREHEQQLELARSLERATREHAKLARAKPPSTGNDSPNGSAANQTHKRAVAAAAAAGITRTPMEQLLVKAAHFVRDTIACLRGDNLATSLEESGALECFEDALRLRDPPEQMFAGDRKFQLFVGSLLTSLPNFCMGLLGPSVAPSLYR